MSHFVSSKYNFLIDLPEGGLAYNALSGGFAKLNIKNYEYLRNIIADPDKEVTDEEYKKIFSEAVRGRYLISHDSDETEILKLRSNLSRFSGDHFHLTIMPTLACNFRCTYCYENFSDEKMTNEMQDALLKWADEKVKRSKLFTVAWFGGEPLLAWNVIKGLSLNFQELCNKYEVKFRSSISTNGYLMTSDKVKEFCSMGIKNIQVTIDGPKEIHDVKRKLFPSNGSTYSVIIENLMTLIRFNGDISISLRVNFDKLNYEHIPRLLDEIPGEIKKRVEIYFRAVFPAPEKWGEKKEAIDNKDLHKIDKNDIVPLFQEAQKRGFILSLNHLTLKLGYCEADFINHFVVDPNGGLHKCTVSFTPEKKIGQIMPDGKAEINTNLLAKWMSKDPFNDDPCRSCKILPLCFGGCNFSNQCGRQGKMCSTVMRAQELKDNLLLLYKNIELQRQKGHK